MLDVGLAVLVRSAQKNARLRLDEAGEIGRDPDLPGAAFLHALVGAAGAFAGLQCLDARCERDVARVARGPVHDRPPQRPRSLNDGWSSGRRPSGQWYLRSLSLIGRSLMLAMRRRIRPCSSNSQFSLP